ncbi:MAG: polyprenyl synthetase family protein [Candidatus Microbacterium phytovorans]|uniref:Polyprenyl synthetase family protein n=1 Tax=Candidatus Microbacterium phytovorans TaxID=3121374 RepID=A0AAJ5W2T0_9MICO|nr:polyprenyl synthetase family protein [Microbacterium sp.]WEK14667.1 MAG: polyprenyl synthetase family protein [Microbacterium sp.]
MIELAPEHRESVDGAIDRALTRLAARARPHGESAQALTAAVHAAAADGKRLRPALVVAAFTAYGGDTDAVPALWDVAAAFEILHTALLVHDDLIDRDDERRGIPNVSGRFRARAQSFGADAHGTAVVADAAAVLAGDLLLFEATRLVATAALTDVERDELFAVLDEALLVSAVGELADAEHAARADLPDAEALLTAAHDKTAVYSFRAPLRAGAILAGAASHPALADAAAALGLAFQLVDDLIGTFGSRSQAGRDPGADLREAKRTPLIALARQSESWSRVSDALAEAHTGPIAVRRAQREIEASGARAGVEELVRANLRRARAHAASPELPPPAVMLLAGIADAIERRIP